MGKRRLLAQKKVPKVPPLQLLLRAAIGRYLKVSTLHRPFHFSWRLPLPGRYRCPYRCKRNDVVDRESLVVSHFRPGHDRLRTAVDIGGGERDRRETGPD